MLTSEEISFFKSILLQQLKELYGKAAYSVAESVSQTEKSIDPLDQAIYESSRTTTLRLRDRESRLINKIKGALDRIEDGSFGICEMCEEEISIGRLRARPVASYCIQCKTKMETYQKLHLEQQKIRGC